MVWTSGVPGIPRQGGGGGASDLDEQGGCVQWRMQDLPKRGGRKNPCATRVERAPHTGGVQGPAPAGGPGAEPPEALEFSANKGLQDGRQE